VASQRLPFARKITAKVRTKARSANEGLVPTARPAARPATTSDGNSEPARVAIAIDAMTKKRPTTSLVASPA
jgi:hypothetical protein